MKRMVAVIAAAATCTMAGAVVNTSIVFQTSGDGVNWFGGIHSYQTGQTVMARALVTYTGPGAPLGLASFVFQPTISNAMSTDVLSPFINGGMGSNTSTPRGVLVGAEAFDTTSFGRVSPWGRSATSSTSALRGFFQSNPNGDGVNYLRIAQSHVSIWIGLPGNTSGGSGVNIAQLSNVGRTTSDPAFNGSLQNIYVFKFGITPDPSGGLRAMTIDAPLAGFGNRNSATGEREIYWWGDMNEASGSIRGTVVVTPAIIFVTPAPATLALLGVGGVLVGRLRRRGVAGRVLAAR